MYVLTTVTSERTIWPVSYRPPSKAPRGAWAKHLHQIRRERALSQQQAFELVQAAWGVSPKSRAVYVSIDMGDRQPREDEAAVLAAEFGWPSEQDAPAAAGTDIAALTRAINDLVQELREERAAVLSALQEQGRVVGLLAALQGLGVDQIAKLLPPGGPPNGPGQSATRGTK